MAASRNGGGHMARQRNRPKAKEKLQPSSVREHYKSLTKEQLLRGKKLKGENEKLIGQGHCPWPKISKS